MGFRTVIISSHSKLEYSLNYLVYRTSETIKRIFLDEINYLIIQSTNVSVTSALINELNLRKIKVIFCDEKANPSCELVSCYGNSTNFRSINNQINWSNKIKDLVWKNIVKEKIKWQAFVLNKYHKENVNELTKFILMVEDGDTTNCEGHAAKIYFNRIFHEGFSRQSSDKHNAYLNYGYSIILSCFNRCIVSSGYLTQLGIHHKNDFNPFNLSCDLMEPYRPIVDDIAHLVNDENFKDKMIDILNINVTIQGKTQKLNNAIQIYVNSIFSSLNKEEINIAFYSDYEL